MSKDRETRRMDRSFHDLKYRLDGTVAHLIWFSDDSDGVVVDDGNRIPVFGAPSGLQEYAGGRGLTVQPADPGANPFILDLDGIVLWLKAPTGGEVTCEAFLDAWNLFDDVARSTQESSYLRISDDEPALYDKLFWGCNLPAVTPPGEHFDPTWSDREVEALRRVFEGGIAMLRRTLKDPAR